MAIITRYGLEGYDFTHGSVVSDTEIKNWINTIKDKFEQEPDEPYHYIQSGNASVYGFKWETEDSIEIHVCRSYQTFHIPFNPKVKPALEKLTPKQWVKRIRLRK